LENRLFIILPKILLRYRIHLAR